MPQPHWLWCVSSNKRYKVSMRQNLWYPLPSPEVTFQVHFWPWVRHPNEERTRAKDYYFFLFCSPSTPKITFLYHFHTQNMTAHICSSQNKTNITKWVKKMSQQTFQWHTYFWVTARNFTIFIILKVFIIILYFIPNKEDNNTAFQTHQISEKDAWLGPFPP